MNKIHTAKTDYPSISQVISKANTILNPKQIYSCDLGGNKCQVKLNSGLVKLKDMGSDLKICVDCIVANVSGEINAKGLPTIQMDQVIYHQKHQLILQIYLQMDSLMNGPSNSSTSASTYSKVG